MDDDEQAIENIAQRMALGKREINLRLEKNIDSGRYGPAAAVPQDDDKLQAATEVIERVPEAAEYFAAEAIASDTDDEQVIRALIEYQLDRDACVRAAKHRGKGALLGRARAAQVEPEIT